MSKVFSERLSLLRKERYSSQKEGAEALGISISRYNKWENDTNSPDYETVCMIAAHYGVTTDYLLGRTSARHPENVHLVSELGLSDAAIENVRGIKSGKFEPYMVMEGWFSAEKDTRPHLYVLDRFLSDNSFPLFIDMLKKLTNPVGRLDSARWEGGPVEWNSVSNSKRDMEDAAYAKIAHDTIDSMISRISESSKERYKAEEEKIYYVDQPLEPNDNSKE